MQMSCMWWNPHGVSRPLVTTLLYTSPLFEFGSQLPALWLVLFYYDLAPLTPNSLVDLYIQKVGQGLIYYIFLNKDQGLNISSDVWILSMFLSFEVSAIVRRRCVFVNISVLFTFVIPVTIMFMCATVTDSSQYILNECSLPQCSLHLWRRWSYCWCLWSLTVDMYDGTACADIVWKLF